NEARYEVSFPWKNESIPKSNGYGMCLKRLHQLKSRLDKDKQLLEQYDNTFKDQEKSGIIDSGPNLVPHLFDTVVNFRGYPIGLVADFKKAFHQIQIAPDNRKMLKFLWFEDISQDPWTLKEYEFRRLPLNFGLTPSPAILSSTISHHLSRYKEIEPKIVSLLHESLYVDDFAGGAYDDDVALHIYRTSHDLMNKGWFNLRKWHSNSASIRDFIATQEDANGSVKDEVTNANLESTYHNVGVDAEAPKVDASLPCSSSQDSSVSKSNCVKILGINWNEDIDEFCYDLGELVEYAKSLPSTKRSVLKLSAKVFDPIGLFAPFTVTMKMLF
ncbi:Hypothetical predicted protein, partial [Paramuricea clavata]